VDRVALDAGAGCADRCVSTRRSSHRCVVHTSEPNVVDRVQQGFRALADAPQLPPSRLSRLPCCACRSSPRLRQPRQPVHTLAWLPHSRSQVQAWVMDPDPIEPDHQPHRAAHPPLLGGRTRCRCGRTPTTATRWVARRPARREALAPAPRTEVNARALALVGGRARMCGGCVRACACVPPFEGTGP